MGLLDLVGLSIFGLIGVISVRGIKSTPQSGKSLTILEIFNLEKSSLITQVIVLGLIAVVFMFTRSVLSIYIGIRSYLFLGNKTSQLGEKLIRQMLSGDRFFLDFKGNQERIYALTTGLEKLGFGIIGLVGLISSDIFLCLLITIVLFVVSPKLTLLAMLILGGSVGILYFALHKRASSLAQRDAKIQIDGASLISELMGSYKQLKLRNRLSYQINLYTKNRNDHLAAFASLSMMPNISKYVIETVMVLSSVLIAGYAFSLGDAVQSVGILTIFMAAISRLAPALLRLQQNAVLLKSNIGFSGPVLELIERLKDIEELHENGSKLDFEYAEFPNKLIIDNVKMAFSSGFSLNKIDLEVLPGETIAIVGPTGAGKSTIADLILGFHTPQSGSVRIGSLSLNECISKWPGSIAYVPQDTYLIPGTIRENLIIGFNDTEIPDEKIWEALELSNLVEFVKKLPQGLESRISEMSSNISGGQRQRIGIARALLTKPRILVLDEATSALDAETENIISQNLRFAEKTQIRIIIAHRLTTVKNATRIMYLENGEVRGIGTFEELRTKIPEFERQAQLSSL